MAVLVLELPGALSLPSSPKERQIGFPATNGVAHRSHVADGGVDRGNQLMLALQNGDALALDHLVDIYNVKLYTFVARMVGDGPAAEDIVQETWVSLYQRRASYTPTHRFSTWLFTIARRKALSEIRRRKVRSMMRTLTTANRNGEVQQMEVPQSTFAQPDTEADGSIVVVMVEKALATLSAQQREIVLLRDVEGFDNDEIARILQWSLRPGTVRKRVFDAREAFRRAMIALGYSER